MKQRIFNLKVRDIVSLYKKGNLDVSFEISPDMIVGRKDVWNTPTKSLFIQSILLDYLLTPLVLIKKVSYLPKDLEETIENTEYAVLEGKQRIMTLVRYVNNEFCLYEHTPPVKSTEIKKLSFVQLPKKLQDKILDFEFTIYENEGTFEENIDMYIRYNNGIPPKPIELFRAKLGLHSKLLNDICNHRLFRLINLNGTKRFQDYELALYLLMLESNHKTGLSKKEKELFVDKISKTKTISKRVRERLKEKLDYLYEAFSRPEYTELRWEDKYLKKSHLTSMYLLLDKAFAKNITPNQFFIWADRFFFTEKDMTNNYWIEVSRGSTTSKNSMSIRNAELLQNFKNYLIEVEKANNKVVNLFGKKKLS